ncbi:AAA family ATPase [Dactylosporangium darangshiense]|uniref:AAA family ATPase n=1 Tax=Dactylosporangium darangshiense TaxID=579108 RepID=UPI00363A282A
MSSLTITRGLPGSGKTTWAKQQPRLVRVNRDDLRRMLHGGLVADPQLRGRAEKEVTAAHHAAVEGLLRAGAHVVCDDTNLRGRVVREFAELAAKCGAHFAVRDFTDVPVEECIRRDALRDGDGRVGEDVIRSMYQRYLAGRALPSRSRSSTSASVRPTSRRWTPHGPCWWTSTARSRSSTAAARTT